MVTISAAESTKSSSPLVVNLGKKTRKQIKKLTKGKGKLLDDVDQVVQELKVAGKISGLAQVVIVVVKQRGSKAFPWSMT